MVSIPGKVASKTWGTDSRLLAYEMSLDFIIQFASEGIKTFWIKLLGTFILTERNLMPENIFYFYEVCRNVTITCC
jgi:hypothetical protein